jgi:hypothetical protein
MEVVSIIKLTGPIYRESRANAFASFLEKNTYHRTNGLFGFSAGIDIEGSI